MFYLFRKKIEGKVKHLFHREVKVNDILNIAMNLSLEWGENWLIPVDERLRAIVPNISVEEAKRVDIFIRDAREDIFKVVEQHYLKEITEMQLKSIVKEKYPFLNDDNYKRLLGQGMYYAWKDNG